nr:reverse transcriptase domain-containing protein [Tanacetum cinerariifolium]
MRIGVGFGITLVIRFREGDGRPVPLPSVYTISAKRTSWNEFSSTMASAVICLSTGADTVVKGDDAQEPSITFPTPPTPPTQQSQDLLLTSQEKEAKVADDDQVKGRQAEIYKIDMDHASKVLSMQKDEPAEVQEVVNVVTTAKLITKVVTAASETFTAASTTISVVEPQVPDATITAVPMEEEKRRVIQSINETITQKAAKRRKLNEEVKDLKRHLEIVPDEDDDLLESCGVHIITFTTTQLISLVERQYPLSRFTLDQMLNAVRLRVEEQSEMSLELLREDLESLWSLVQESFSTSKLNNFSDDFLLTTLGAMFERPDGQAQVWKNQRTVHGQAKTISAKRTSWNEFSSAMVSASICLSTVLDTKGAENLAADHLSRLENPYKNMLDPKEINKKFPLETLGMVTFRGDSSAPWVGKGFSRFETPLFEGMIVAGVIKEEGKAEKQVQDVADNAAASGADTAEKKKEKEAKVADDDQVKGRQAEIYKIDMDHASKVLSMQKDEPAEVQDVVNVVTTAKLITEVVTAASETFTAASTTIFVVEPQVPDATITAVTVRVVAASTKRRKRVVIGDPKEESTTIIPADTKKWHEELNKDIDWDVAINHVKQKAKEDPTVQRYQTMKRKPLTEAQSQRNIIMYLKNVAGFILDYFKGMSYDDIRLIFKIKFNSNVDFILKTKEHMEEEKRRVIQSINETLTQKAAKRRKLNKEVKDLKRHLEIVRDEDDDVYTESTPLARKVPVVDYEIIHLNNKPHYKIIRAGRTHQLYVSFLTLLKNSDREDLESLWSLVQESFSTSKLNNFSDDFLLTTLGAMFERPDGQAQVWKNQRIVHGQAKVKS